MFSDSHIYRHPPFFQVHKPPCIEHVTGFLINQNNSHSTYLQKHEVYKLPQNQFIIQPETQYCDKTDIFTFRYKV